MKLSVIIIGYNSWHYLEKNLASIAFLQNDPQTEIIYVDNASTDGAVDKIRRLYPNIIIIENSKNVGVATARNKGIRMARGKYLWFLDSDTEVSEIPLTTMLTFMDEHPEVGLCGCKIVGYDEKVQSSCRKFPTIAYKLKAVIHIIAKKGHLNIYSSSQQNTYDTDVEAPFEVDYVIGACQIIRKKAQEQIGVLDEHIFYGPEDADFCLRMKRGGFQVFYLPQVSIYHAYQRTSSHRFLSKTTREHIKGLIYYFWKYRK
ncbi:glycosyl transferase [Bacteroidia bacterium]|nr:glycosyl transferase [Bacteroidia bacterium]